MKKLILFALIALCMVTPAFAFPRICDMWWNGTSCNYTATGNDVLNVSFRQTVTGDNLTVWVNTAQWATHNATFNGDDYWHVFAPYDEVPPFQQGMNNVTMFVHTANPSNDCTLTCWLNLTDAPAPINLTDCAVLNRSGMTYYLKVDILDNTVDGCMSIIETPNIILDCEGHLIEGHNLEAEAILIYASDNTTVRNCFIEKWAIGIEININPSANVRVYNNYFSNNTEDARIEINDTYLNTTNSSGINILGQNYMGGNYWDDYSNTCLNLINDTFCDVPYNLSQNGTAEWIFAYDYLPLTSYNYTSNEQYSLTGCAVLNETANYTLANDIDVGNPDADCFLGTSGKTVVLDCEGHSIANGHFIFEFYNHEASSLTVKNCVMTDSSLVAYIGYGTSFKAYNNTFINAGGINCNLQGSCEAYNNSFYNTNTVFYTHYQGNSNWHDNYIQNAGSVFSQERSGVSSASNNTVDSASCIVTLYADYPPWGSFNIYNNYFFNYSNAICNSRSDLTRNWNTTIQNGTRIINSTIWSTIGGNYWSGFSCDDSDFDGYCDSPYVIDSNNVDYLPLKLAEIVCDDSEITCLDNNLVQCHEGLGYDVIEDCEKVCFESHCTTQIEVILTEVGSGFGSLLDLITAPFAYMLLIFAMISSVFTIFYVIATAIKNSFR